MPKFIGECYDPEIRTSESGVRLYNAWRKLRKNPHCEEWDNYPAFYNWAMQSGYVLGAWLRLKEDTNTYNPDNCVWYIPVLVDGGPPKPTWEDEWNKTVNRIRRHYGMPPLRGTSYDE